MDMSSSVEVMQREIAGSAVKLARWRAEADRPIPVSTRSDVEFLVVTDWQDAFFTLAQLYIAPYPKACCAMCDFFEQACFLTKELRPPLLVLLPQNLILGIAVHEFASLLRDLPELRVIVCSGCFVDWLREAGLGTLLDSERGTPRIEVLPLPLSLYEFFAAIARQFEPSPMLDGKSVID